jgi:putative membrane protein
MNNRFKLFFNGMLMGVAEIIPGVSGGTIAFITGIYEELIESIKSINFNDFTFGHGFFHFVSL